MNSLLWSNCSTHYYLNTSYFPASLCLCSHWTRNLFLCTFTYKILPILPGLSQTPNTSRRSPSHPHSKQDCLRALIISSPTQHWLHTPCTEIITHATLITYSLHWNYLRDQGIHLTHHFFHLWSIKVWWIDWLIWHLILIDYLYIY